MCVCVCVCVRLRVCCLPGAIQLAGQHLCGLPLSVWVPPGFSSAGTCRGCGVCVRGSSPLAEGHTCMHAGGLCASEACLFVTLTEELVLLVFIFPDLSHVCKLVAPRIRTVI